MTPTATSTPIINIISWYEAPSCYVNGPNGCSSHSIFPFPGYCVQVLIGTPIGQQKHTSATGAFFLIMSMERCGTVWSCRNANRCTVCFASNAHIQVTVPSCDQMSICQNYSVSEIVRNLFRVESTLIFRQIVFIVPTRQVIFMPVCIPAKGLLKCVFCPSVRI